MANDTKDRLMEAALDLLCDSSYGATSVDAICERAGVRKGSFYHFFESKSDLAVAALDVGWRRHRAELDEIFSPSMAPLERFRRAYEAGVERQKKMLAEKGYVCGCPLFNIGSEMGTQDQSIRRKVEEILALRMKYYESAIRDAHAEGSIEAPDPAAKARIVFAFIEGMLTQARIMNDMKPIHEIASGVFEILGVREPALPSP